MEGAGVGAIVWVRRRNGSWWPGRILGAAEVSASHLMSPRSGTPVKLLGREDASVDWYNLEKSRRVKAFRCGEFDDCIERAEASPCMPMRKREKYARREDAILHALELEKQFEMKHRKGNISVGTSEKTTGVPKKGLNCSSEVYMRNGDPGLYDKFASYKYQTIPRKIVVPYQGDNVSKLLYINKMESGKTLGWEENIPESVPRISGLQGFGLPIAPSKLSPSVTWETSGSLFENHADVLSCAGHMMEDSVLPVNADGGKSSVFAKRKRSEVDMVEDTLVGQHDTCQQLLQGLQSSVKLPNYHSFHSDSDAGTVSREDEINHLAPACRAKRTPCIYLPASSIVEIDHSVYQSEEIGTTETQLKMDDQQHQPASLAEDHSSSGLVEATESLSSERVIWEDEVEEEGNTLTDKFGRMNKDAMPLSSSISQSHLNVQTMYAEIGVYSWHVKGKRKRRNVAKRTLSRTKRKTFPNVADKDNSSVKEMAYGGEGNSFTVGGMDSSSHRTLGQDIFPNKEFTHAYDGGVLGDNNLPITNLTGYSSRKYYSLLQEAKGHGMNDISFDDSDSGSQLISHSGWENEGPSHASQRVYWGESDDCFDPVSTSRINDEMEPMLVDVDLKVQSRYQGEHVPLVSLMSRLNGKSIIGHPVQVEILEEGSSGRAFFRNYGGLADNTASAWWTARGTGTQRVISSSPATSAFKVDYADFLQYSDRENTLINYSSQFSHQAQLAKKSMSYVCEPMSRKSHKKSANRVNLQSNYKNRRRSSVTTDQKRKRRNTGKCTLSSGDNLLSRLINPEAALPSVTCVPLKVVFSRILEAVGRPSAAAAHRVRMTMAAVKDPS